MTGQAMTVGFVGLGAMGSRMAGNLLRAGMAVRAWNRDPRRIEPLAAAGAIACATPREAATGADAVVMMVADDDASREVMLGDEGILAGARAGMLVIDSTTTTPGLSRDMAAAAAARGAAYLDAPVLGSLVQAENRELVFVVGGDAAAFDRAMPVLSAMGRLVRRVGPTGAGATLKLINNTVSATLTAALAEAAWVAEAAGVDPAALLEILSEGAAGSRLTKGKLPKMLARDFVPQFQVALMEKDVRYFMAMADAFGRRTPVFSTVAGIFRASKDAGYGSEDTAAIIRLLEGEAARKA